MSTYIPGMYLYILFYVYIHIINSLVVDCALATFGCVEWESDLFRGVMCARWYPFDMPEKQFHSFNQRFAVMSLILCTYGYILVHT